MFQEMLAINSFLELHQEMLAKKDAMECTQHKKSLEAFCETCQELVCIFCITRSHSNHHVQMIVDLIDKCKKCQLTVQPVALGRKACCQLSIKDSNGSPLPISTSLISCQLIASNGLQPADCTITKTGPGIYEINYTLIIRISHHLRVMVGGVDIPGSVFLVPVLPSSPETRGQPLHTIQGMKGPWDIAISCRG